MNNSGIEYHIMQYCRGIRPYLNPRFVTHNTYDDEEVIDTRKSINILSNKSDSGHLIVGIDLDDDYKCTAVSVFRPIPRDAKDEILKTYYGVEIRPSLNMHKKENTIFDEYVCELTKECDNYLLDSIKDTKAFKDGIYTTYLIPFDKSKGIWSLRIPGRTVGAVYTDANNYITKVLLDADCGYYENIKQFRLDEFIGIKLKMPIE